MGTDGVHSRRLASLSLRPSVAPGSPLMRHQRNEDPPFFLVEGPDGRTRRQNLSRDTMRTRPCYVTPSANHLMARIARPAPSNHYRCVRPVCTSKKTSCGRSPSLCMRLGVRMASRPSLLHPHHAKLDNTKPSTKTLDWSVARSVTIRPSTGILTTLQTLRFNRARPAGLDLS